MIGFCGIASTHLAHSLAVLYHTWIVQTDSVEGSFQTLASACSVAPQAQTFVEIRVCTRVLAYHSALEPPQGVQSSHNVSSVVGHEWYYRAVSESVLGT